MKIKVGTPEWLVARRSLITATDSGVILGINPWKTALQLYHDKINGTESKQNEAMRLGLALESEARVAFEQLTGHITFPEFRHHPDIKWMAASFDGINDQGIVLEIKAPGQQDHDLALLGQVPEKYIAQLQHQMKVAEVGQCFYFSYRPGITQDVALIKVDADPEFQQNMLIEEYKFYQCLVNKTPPEATERDCLLREDRPWLLKEEELYRLNAVIAEFEAKRDEIRKDMIEMCDGRMTKGYRLKFNPVTTRGTIDYSRIEVLKDLDLELYRKPSSVRWRVDPV